jgi:uncharacterized protein
VKINPGWRPFGNIKPPEQPSSPQIHPKNFGDFMQQHEEKAGQEQLNRMLEQIQLQGERLLKSMTVRELRAYKLLIQRFLEETVRRGVSMKDTRGWDRRGRGKRYKILDEIDGKLLELADDMLNSEQGRVDILNKVGEIRGMLINLLF